MRFVVDEITEPKLAFCLHFYLMQALLICMCTSLNIFFFFFYILLQCSKTHKIVQRLETVWRAVVMKHQGQSLYTKTETDKILQESRLIRLLLLFCLSLIFNAEQMSLIILPVHVIAWSSASRTVLTGAQRPWPRITFCKFVWYVSVHYNKGLFSYYWDLDSQNDIAKMTWRFL